MSTVTKTKAEGQRAESQRVQKRVILSMGGKGGVGKTSVIAALAEWFETNEIPAKLLDLDTENKARGSLTHFFGGHVPKLNIHTAAGLDAFIDHLQDGPSVILADMGAGSGRVTHEWFHAMYPDVADAGLIFTAIGVVTSDPASVESVLAWAAQLQNRVAYGSIRGRSKDKLPHIYIGRYPRFEEPAVRDFLERKRRSYPARMLNLKTA